MLKIQDKKKCMWLIVNIYYILFFYIFLYTGKIIQDRFRKAEW